MLLYEITNLPDITLSKYQAVEESGIESMLEAQTRLIRQSFTDLPLLEKLLHIIFMHMIRKDQMEISLKFMLHLQRKDSLNNTRTV